MLCVAPSCERKAVYKAAQLCQKHYFRLRRNGSLEKLPTSRKERIIAPNGYVRIYEPSHPLADQRGYVFEHRRVIWSVVGEACGDCALCGKPETWMTCHVDHIDESRQNNDRSNLRILCRGCNVKRGMTSESQSRRTGLDLIEFDGLHLTAHEWASDPRVLVSGRTIRARKRSGMSDYDALFAPKVTHKQSKPEAKADGEVA